MMFRFWRRRKDKPSAMYPVVLKVETWVNAQQRRAADWLNARINRYSVKQLKVMLFVFCILFGGSSIYITLHVFTRSEPAIHATPLKILLQANDSLPEIENIYNKLRQSK